MSDNIHALFEVQKRFQFLTKQVGLDDDEEALHALDRRRGCSPEYRVLTRQGQLGKIQELVDYPRLRGVVLSAVRRWYPVV